MEDLRRKYKKEMYERKKLHNTIQELKGNIRVYMRYVGLFHDSSVRSTSSYLGLPAENINDGVRSCSF